jgi:hypothetical protein
VRQHQESTERQYALREKALQLGWPPERGNPYERAIRRRVGPPVQLVVARRIRGHEKQG